MGDSLPSITINLDVEHVVNAVFVRATTNDDDGAGALRRIIIRYLITYYSGEHRMNTEETRIIGELTLVLVNRMNAQVSAQTYIIISETNLV